VKACSEFGNSHVEVSWSYGLYTSQLVKADSKMAGSILYQVAQLEYYFVEFMYIFFLIRWCEHGSTLLIIDGWQKMTIPEIIAIWRERFRIVGRLPA